MNYLKKTMSVFLLYMVLLSCSAEEKPNVIILLADDAGYADFGFMGSKDLSTPNIDRIASDGVAFSDFHVTGSVCAPSRAGLMTGRYQHRFGAEFNNHPDGIGVPTSELMLAEMLKKEGYATAAYGKWHIGSKDECHPNNRGFDEFYGFISGHRTYFPHPKYDKPGQDKAMQRNGEYIVHEGYLTDDLGHKAIDFIRQNKKNPFFIYLAYNAVHTPMEATEEDLALYKEHPRQVLAAMTHALDRSVGEVLTTLEKEDILDNTLVFFLSDNGGPSKSNTSFNGPLKAVKGTEFEGGHRVACAMMWKDKINGGVKYEKLSSSLDIFSTIKAATKVASSDHNTLDGVDLVPHVTGINNNPPHEKLFWRIQPWAAARHNEYKLVDADSVGQGLYDLSSDIGEMNNLSSEKGEKLSALTNDLLEWESQMPPSRGKREGAWEVVKGYMYYDYLNNQEIRYTSPSDLKKIKKQDK